ncbi:MAG: hypothetical protein ABIT96_10855 [Ferruginibacter sp.]
MKNLSSTLMTFIALMTITLGLSSCEAIGGIFKAGMWTGVIVIVLVVALVLYIISRARR